MYDKKKKVSPRRYVPLVNVVVLFVLVVLTVWFVFVQLTKPYVLAEYTIIPNSTILVTGTKDVFAGKELERIESMHITIYSDNTLQTTGWPLSGNNTLEYEKTKDCASRNCIKFSYGTGYSGSNSGYYQSYTFNIDVEFQYLYLVYVDSHSTWGGEGDNFSKQQQERKTDVTFTLE